MPPWQRLWIFIGAPIIAVADVFLTHRPDLLRGPRLAVYASTTAATIAMFWGIAVDCRNGAILASLVHEELGRDEPRNIMSA
jgi:hypothetical protein